MHIMTLFLVACLPIEIETKHDCHEGTEEFPYDVCSVLVDNDGAEFGCMYYGSGFGFPEGNLKHVGRVSFGLTSLEEFWVARENENCYSLNSDGEMHHTDCEEELGFICSSNVLYVPEFEDPR